MNYLIQPLKLDSLEIENLNEANQFEGVKWKLMHFFGHYCNLNVLRTLLL